MWQSVGIALPIVERRVAIENVELRTLHFLDGFVVWIDIAITGRLFLLDLLILPLVQALTAKNFVAFGALDDVALWDELADFADQVLYLGEAFYCLFRELIDAQLDGAFGVPRSQLDAPDFFEIWLHFLTHF